MFAHTRTIAIAAIAILANAPLAHADGMPGLRGHDHTGITVPDIKRAIDFFVNVLGCKEAMSFGPFSDDKTTFMHDLLNVDPRAVIHQITLVRCGYGSSIELFQYSAPDQKNMTPKNSDIGGYHIAFYVDDIKAAKDYLDRQGREAWAHEGATHSPILAAISVEPDSGKSTLLGVLRFLVPKPFVSVELTGPSVYRTVDREHPTLIIDEADDLFYRKSGPAGDRKCGLESWHEDSAAGALVRSVLPENSRHPGQD